MIVMTTHIQPVQAGWWFHKDRLFLSGQNREQRQDRVQTHLLQVQHIYCQQCTSRVLFTLAWPESDLPLNEFACSTTELQFFQKYCPELTCPRCNERERPVGLCQHPSPGEQHPAQRVWEALPQHRHLCEQQKLLEGLCFLCKCT